jgi:soluble lytic murein transglycosylase-like protein
MGFTGKLKDLYDGEVNAKWAAKYLKYQLVRYHNDWRKAIAAYNAGTAIVSKKNKAKGWYINEDYIGKVMDAVVE